MQIWKRSLVAGENGYLYSISPNLVYKWFMAPTAHVYVQSGSPRAKRLTRGNLGQGKERGQ